MPDVQGRAPCCSPTRSAMRCATGTSSCSASTSWTAWRRAAGGTAPTAAARTAPSTIPRPRRWPQRPSWTAGGSTVRRADLQEVIAVAEPVRTAALAAVIVDAARRAAPTNARTAMPAPTSSTPWPPPRAALEGRCPSDAELARLAYGADRPAGARHAVRAGRGTRRRARRVVVGAAGANPAASRGASRRSCCWRFRPTRVATGRWRECRWRPRCGAIPTIGWRACWIRRCSRGCGPSRSGSWRSPATGWPSSSACELPPRRSFGRRAG